MNLDPEMEERLVEELAQRIKALGLIEPALFFLESNRPVAFLGSQILHFFQPLLGFVAGQRLALYAALFESDEAVGRLADRLEELSEDSSGGSGGKERRA